MTQNDAMYRLRGLTVSDVMNKQVVTISATQPMSEVAQTFRQHNISAAPVIDEAGRFVGILSATDFLRRHDVGASDATDRPDAVQTFMTRSVRTVAPDNSLLRAALMMSSNHLHRLPVLDQQQGVVGMISTMDITAAIVNIVDEMDTDLLRAVAAPSTSRD